MTAAEISIIPEFQDKISLLGMDSDVEITRTNIRHKVTGTDILFSGIKTSSGNQTARLKSIPKLNVFIVDEAEEFVDEAAFDTIDESIRREDAPNIVLIAMNPQTTDHWVYRRWFEGYTKYRDIDGHQVPISTHPQLTHIHTTWHVSKAHLSQDYLDKITHLRDTQPAKYAHRFLGQWLERSEGAVYQNWIEGAFDESLPSAYGLDFGFFPDPLALVEVAIDKKLKRVYVRQHLYATNLSTSNVRGDVARRTGRKPVICDTSEPRLIAELQEAGVNAQKADKGPDSILNGIRALQDFTIVVSQESHDIKRELRLYSWNDKKHSIPIDAHNHAMDALRYCFTFLNAGSSFVAGR
jgi:phage terminase large subunit